MVVRLITQDSVEGWDETYGLVAPKATAKIINDLLAGFVIGRDPFEAEAIHDQLYELMRVRGYTGGFIDIALYDIAGKVPEFPVVKLLGGFQHDTIHAYISGLLDDTLKERCQLAASWQERGYNAQKVDTIITCPDHYPLLYDWDRIGFCTAFHLCQKS